MTALEMFITGTDTGAGKTYVTSGLLRSYAQAGYRAAGMKPIASGAVWRNGRLANDDVDALIAASNISLPRECVNSYLFEPPASPHLAARPSGATIELAPICAALAASRAAADVVIVEGVGGWCVPLSETLWLADLARALDLPAVLVVGIKLGCINHALLTAREMCRAGLPPRAWVANVVEPGLYALPDVIDTLRRHLDAPLAGVLAHRVSATATDEFDALAASLEALLRVGAGPLPGRP